MTTNQQNAIKSLKDKLLLYESAIISKCSDCMCNYADGHFDCEVLGCPLYDFMPFRAKKPMRRITHELPE